MSGRKMQGFSFYVELPTQVEGKPTEQNIVNNFDYHGDLLSLRRNNGENNSSYKERLLDVAVHPGGPLYEGIVNSIARELGMLRVASLRIDLKTDSTGETLASNPRVDILANRVVLYNEWRPDGAYIIDRVIPIYKLDDQGYYLNTLVDAINDSEYFTAELLNNIRPNTISSTMVRNSSVLTVRQENIRSDKMIILESPRVITGSMSFQEKDIFQTEVSYEPTEEGQFMVDYLKGEVFTYLQPSGQGYCSYMTINFPMNIDTVPVQVFTFQDPDFQKELFHQETMDSGETENGLPNAEGAEIYHQLYKETKVFWGE